VGSWLVLHDDDVERRALIVETEAYGGSDDPASHAFRGPTKRSAIMFGPAGFLYVYLIYGVHWCMNVVTGPEGTATAVLLRGAELLVPKPGGVGDESVALRGPGNLTRGLGITGADNGLDCCRAEGRHLTFHRTRRHKSDLPTGQSKRIGITREIDRPRDTSWMVTERCRNCRRTFRRPMVKDELEGRSVSPVGGFRRNENIWDCGR